MAPVALAFADAVRCLRAGGVLLLATDTLPGLHARADRPAAVARINALKGRPAGKSLLVLAGSLDQARSVTAAWNPAQESACRRCWPGPFTLILPAAAGLAAAVTGGGATLAVRVPATAELRDLVLAVGVPLVSTSANRAGDPPARDLAEAAGAVGSGVDGCWSPAPSPGRGGPSALVDLTATPFRVLREGPEPFVATVRAPKES